METSRDGIALAERLMYEDWGNRVGRICIPKLDVPRSLDSESLT